MKHKRDCLQYQIKINTSLARIGEGGGSDFENIQQAWRNLFFLKLKGSNQLQMVPNKVLQ